MSTVEEVYLTCNLGMHAEGNGSRFLVGRRLGICFQVPGVLGSPGPTLLLGSPGLLLGSPGPTLQKLCRGGAIFSRIRPVVDSQAKDHLLVHSSEFLGFSCRVLSPNGTRLV